MDRLADAFVRCPRAIIPKRRHADSRETQAKTRARSARKDAGSLQQRHPEFNRNGSLSATSPRRGQAR